MRSVFYVMFLGKNIEDVQKQGAEENIWTYERESKRMEKIV